MSLVINSRRSWQWVSPMVLVALGVLLFAFSTMIPMAKAADDGEEDLLSRAKTALTTVPNNPTSSENVRFPTSASGAIELKEAGRNLQVDLPNSADEQKVAGRSAGEALYPDLAKHTTMVAQSMGGQGVRLMSVLNSERAPQRLEYGLTSQTGVKLALDQRGGVVVRDGAGSPLAYVMPPWALDAKGKSVATHYEVVDNEIVQVVEHQGTDVAYPVIADPWVCGWVSCQYEFGKMATADVANLGWGAAAGCAAIGGGIALANPPAGVIMAATCALRWESVVYQAQRAESRKMCLRIVVPVITVYWYPDIYGGNNCT